MATSSASGNASDRPSETSVTSDLGELPFLMIRAIKAMVADATARKDDAEPEHQGLTAIHGLAARYLDDHDDVTIGELAAYLRITKQSASEIVTALEKAGGVERRPHPADGRARIIELTEWGRDGLVRSRDRWGELVREWADEVGTDDLVVVARALEAYLDAHPPEP